MKILFAGGGTLGPVIPLLAIANTWKQTNPSVEFIWAGTSWGPEKAFIEHAQINFYSFPIVRLRRSFSWEWFILPWRFLHACWMAWKLLQTQQPDLIASVGGFTTVPFMIVGWVLGIPSWIHQQDMVISLTTRLSTPFASSVSVAWPSLLSFFPAKKTILLGNPVREEIQYGNRDQAQEQFHLDSKYPTLLVMGGGSGSLWINKQISQILSKLLEKINIIHITGQGKQMACTAIKGRYVVREFLMDELACAYAIADIILSRCGMGSITECAALHKTAIFIPLVDSPQEKNAMEIKKQQAAIVLSQENTDAQILKQTIFDLIDHPKQCKILADRMHELIKTNTNKAFILHLEELIKNKGKKR